MWSSGFSHFSTSRPAVVVLCAGAWMASTPWLEGSEAIVLRTDLRLRKEILWESERGADAEVHATEMKLNRENVTNDPAVGYNVLPQWRPSLMAAAERRRAAVSRDIGNCPSHKVVRLSVLHSRLSAITRKPHLRRILVCRAFLRAGKAQPVVSTSRRLHHS